MAPILRSSEPSVARAVKPSGGAVGLGLTLKGLIAHPEPRASPSHIRMVHRRIDPLRSGVFMQKSGQKGAPTLPSRAPGIESAPAWPAHANPGCECCRSFNRRTPLAVLFKDT